MITEISAKRRIYLNGFDMFTVGHLSFGQWKNPADRSATKRRDLSYWTKLAKILEKGDFNALFLADTYGLYDTYKGTAEPAIRNGAQYPMGDPAIVRPYHSSTPCIEEHRITD
jgi:alkanesulfonate monooxygenase SsuD/methylene tetrahydromethanopterin reductase-like flavin-dependent oxidoreductase (luciferase family)